MRTISGPLKTAVSQEATTLATLVDVVSSGGKALYFTSCDRDIVYDGNTYSAGNGCNTSQVRTVLGTSVESVTVDLLITDTGISAGIIESGSLDNATLRVLVVDFTNPSTALIFFQGFVSSVSYKDRITAELQAQAYLSQDATIASDIYSSNCRADLGDAKCKVNIDNLKLNTTVTAVASRQQFSYAPSGITAIHKWQAGSVIFTTGQNETFSFEIQDSSVSGVVTLKGVMPFPIAVGDEITLYPGCDKTTTMCNDRYDNILNFRGEPFSIPPWIATSEATVDGATSVSVNTTVAASTKRALYVYGTIVGGSLNGLGPVTYAGVRIPAWGPYKDVWGFGDTSVGGGSGTISFESGDVGSGGELPSTGATLPLSGTSYFVATEETAGTFGTVHMYWNSVRQLNDDEAALVRLKYPDA